MFYYCPWQPDLRMTAEQIEARIAQCAAMGLPPNTPADAYQTAINALPPATVAQVQEAGRMAAEQWRSMTQWRMKGTHDEEPILPAMQSGLYEYFFLVGGRAGGKSHEVAEAIVELCSNEAKRVVCGREFMASVKDSSRSLLVKKIKDHHSVNDWTINDTELRHKNGTLITFLGMARNPDSAKSLEGCEIFWGEEAQSFSAKSVETLLPTIRESGSMLLFTLNLRFTDDPIGRMAVIPAERPEASFYKVVQFEDNPFIFTSRLMNDLRRSFRISKRFKHVWRGDFDRNTELRIVDYRVGRPPMPDSMPTPQTFYGIDFGGTDPTACVRLHHWTASQVGRDRGILYIDREFCSPCRSNREIVQGVEVACPELKQGRWILKADSADPKAIGELNAAGIPTDGASKGDGSVLGGIRTIADHEVWVAADCTKTQEAAENYRWKADRAGRPTNVPEHTFSHIWDAVRYAIVDENLADGGSVDYIVVEEVE